MDDWDSHKSKQATPTQIVYDRLIYGNPGVNPRSLHNSVARVQLLLFAVFSFTAFQEAQEPIGRGLQVPTQPILVVDIDQAEALCVALRPFEVVQ